MNTGSPDIQHHQRSFLPAASSFSCRFHGFECSIGRWSDSERMFEVSTAGTTGCGLLSSGLFSASILGVNKTLERMDPAEVLPTLTPPRGPISSQDDIMILLCFGPHPPWDPALQSLSQVITFAAYTWRFSFSLLYSVLGILFQIQREQTRAGPDITPELPTCALHASLFFIHAAGLSLIPPLPTVFTARSLINSPYLDAAA
ncbi:hypothetical protein OH77DRAFT_1096405 [Trametes cingulata]|nr:hypothetical protein OH77DRAFT_1096405 [Trametes cingulata]